MRLTNRELTVVVGRVEAGRMPGRKPSSSRCACLVNHKQGVL